jgi:ParB-like chromosome segregation protein Spo0J
MTPHFPSPNVDEVAVVPIASLRPAHSPRLHGEDAEHVRALADAIADLPPIIVHRRTMRVVDGMHRVLAAVRRGQETIEVRLFDGTDNEAFVLAVRENVVHGLPLSLADRKAAAARIVSEFPQWSDRGVATLVGLAPSSVAAIRRCSTGSDDHLNTRIGRDGRARPLDAAQRRRRVSELIAAHPDASLRQIAKEAEVSVGTAYAVRKRMVETGQLTVAPPTGTPGEGTVEQMPPQRTAARGHAVAGLDWPTLRQQLRADPALRYTESGRTLLRWLDEHAISPGEWARIAGAIPPHWATALANVAARFATEWRGIADMLERGTEDSDLQVL